MTDSATRRLERLAAHLLMHGSQDDSSCMSASLCAGSSSVSSGSLNASQAPQASLSRVSFSAEDLRRFWEHDNFEIRSKVTEWMLANPIFRPQYDLNMHEQRELTLLRLKAFADAGWVDYDMFLKDMRRFYAPFETISIADMDLSTKSGVQYSLWGGTVAALGTERHRHYLDKIARLEIPGSFMLTEMGHGSNANGVETTATYDPATQEFVLHSPTISSQKHWIGNAAEHGQMAVVFAKLFVNGNNEGLHGFVVRFRNPDGSLPAGVSVRDCGVKMGLNGVDNGRLMFDHVRIPRENLLNKFGDVTADGRYVSSVSSIHKRFLLTIGELVGGRVGVAGTALTQTLTCLSIAIRYAEQRRQFGPANKPEIPILDYTTHQYILFPLLARTIAYKTAHLYVKDRYADRTPADSEAVTVLAGGIKALATWHAVEAMQKCRELCGGNGFGAMNRIGVFATSHNVAVTYEGENSVLLSQVGKSLLTEFQRNYEKNGGLFGLLTQRFTTAVLDKNPVYKRLVSIDHMLDLGMHMRAFQYRQQKLIVELGRKVRKERKNHRGDAFSAWNACLLDVQDAATAYMDAVVLDRVILSAGGEAPESIRDILSLLGALYALSKIQENMGFYMTHKYFAPAKAEAVRTAMLRICEALRPVAADIVNAIRDERLLFAPIAQKDYITQFAFDKHVEKRDRDPEVVKLIHDSLRSRGKRVEVVE